MHYAAVRDKDPSVITIEWRVLRAQLMLQWKRLSAQELDSAGPDRRRIARLIENKYGIARRVVENYLSNFEHTMPSMTGMH